MTTAPRPQPAGAGVSRPAIGVLGLVRLAEFRRLWLAGAVSGTMRWLELLAVGLWVLDATGSPLMVAAALGSRQTPMLFGPLIGAVADRIGRRRTLTLILALVSVNAATLFVLQATGALGFVHVLAGAFLNGFHHAAEFPVRRAMLGDTVPRQQVGPALSLDSATVSLTRALGPILGASLYAGVGLLGAYGVSAALYAVAAVMVARARYTPALGREHRQGLVRTLRVGFAFVRGNRLVAGALAVTAIANFFAYPFASMIPVIGRDTLHLGDRLIGFLGSAEGTGALVGAILLVRIAQPSGYTRIYTGGTAIFILGIAAFSQATGFAAAYAALLIGGFAAAGFAAMQGTLVFLSTPPEIRSRVMGTLSLCIGVQPFGVMHLGWLAETIGAANAVLLVAAEGAVALLLAALVFRPLLRSSADLMLARGEGGDR